MRAGDRHYAAFVLACMSRMTTQLGQNTPTETDQLRHGRHAAALARAGLNISAEQPTPVMLAELHALEGRGLALLGDTRGTRQAVLAAERDARCFAQTDLTRAHLLNCDPEQAATLGRAALRTAADVSSQRVPDRLRTLQRQIAPLRSASPHLTDLDAQITDFLTRSTHNQQHDAR